MGDNFAARTLLPRDANKIAKSIADIATSAEEQEKDPAAVSLRQQGPR
jgi:hypothetical protein